MDNSITEVEGMEFKDIPIDMMYRYTHWLFLNAKIDEH